MNRRKGLCWAGALALPAFVFTVVFAPGRAAAADTPTEVRAGDAESLFQAAMECEGQKKTALAERGFRQVLKLGDGPRYAEAAYRLALIELGRREFEHAYARLREVSSKYGHAGAREALAKAENETTRKQRSLVESGDKAFETEHYEDARKAFTQAYELLPRNPTTSDFVPRVDLLTRLARTVDRLDDEYAKKTKVAPIERAVRACTRCGVKDGGFAQCDLCKGKGTVERRIALRGGGYTIRYVDCGDCGKFGWVFCKECLGLESTIDKKLLTPREGDVLVKVISHVRSLKTLKLPVDDALRDVEETILRVEESAALNVLRAIKPRYTLCPELKAALSTVPPDAAALKALAGPWAAAKLGVRTRASFLMSYACDYARYVQAFDMLRPGRDKGKADFKAPPVASARLPAAPVGPEVLSAFPEEGTSGWIAVEATSKGYAERSSDPYKGYFQVAGEAPHNVNFFLWRPAAMPHLERLEKGPWGTRVAGLPKAYPFPLAQKAAAATDGRKVTLVGRFLRDRLGFPRNWFEVWDVRIGLTPAQEKIRRALAEPVEVSFPGIEGKKLTDFLRVWFGTTIVLRPEDSAVALAIESRECPLGLFVDEVAKALGRRWRYASGSLVFDEAEGGRGGADPDAEAALVELRSTTKPETLITVSARGRGSPAGDAPKAVDAVPDDPVLIRKAAEEALSRMSYAAAARCLEKLAAKAGTPAERDKLGRLRERVLLYDAVTGRVQTSRLADAAELSRLEIKNPNGEVYTQTVNVVKESGGKILLEPAYGGRITISRDLVRREVKVSGTEWRAQKAEEIDAQASAAASLEGGPRAQRYFLLAIAAKSNGLLAKGTGFIGKAVDDAAFEVVLSTYFPGRDDLVLAWRKVSGQKPAAAPPAAAGTESVKAPAGPHAKAEAVKVDEPLPAGREALLEYGRRHLEAGKALLAKALPGMDDATKNRKAARTHFQASRDALDRALESDPRDVDALRLKRDVASWIQTCVKDMGLFD